MTKAIIFDVSRYQDYNGTPEQIDFEKLALFCDGVIIRAAFGDKQDEDFTYNWAAAKAAGLPRGAYTYYDYRKLAAPQAMTTIIAIGDDKPELQVAWDMEYLDGVPLPNSDNYINSCMKAMQMLYDEYGTLLSYLNKDFQDNYLGSVRCARLATISDLWAAHWGVDAPYVGAWQDWKYWQDGVIVVDPNEYGIESKEIDHNYYNGTTEEFYANEVGEDPTEPPIEPPPDCDLTEVYQLLAAQEKRINALEGKAQKVKEIL